MNRTDLLKKGISTGEFKSKLYKFREFGKRTDEIIEKSQFYFSSPVSFNDPFDCNLAFKDIYSKQEIKDSYKLFCIRYPRFKPKDLEKKYSLKSKNFVKGFQKIYSDMVKNTGILSLSESNKNITMWSHYSKEHTGLSFELDVTEDYNFFDLYGIVEYKNSYNLLSYAKDRVEELPKLFLTKYTDWKYEKEIRIIDYEKHGTRKFKKTMLKTIYFGCKSKEKDIRHIINLCQDNGFDHVDFKKGKMKNGEFSLEFNKINKKEYLKK